MALVQAHHHFFKADNIVRLNHPLRDAAPIGQIRARVAHAYRRLLRSMWRQRTRVAQWSAQRHARSGLTMAERARRRRELERFSDRELRDIGITRYEIEFVLRQPTRR
jgi:uncharacterized protein YjiS (DUF1127 family)